MLLKRSICSSDFCFLVIAGFSCQNTVLWLKGGPSYKIRVTKYDAIIIIKGNKMYPDEERCMSDKPVLTGH